MTRDLRLHRHAHVHCAQRSKECRRLRISGNHFHVVPALQHRRLETRHCVHPGSAIARRHIRIGVTLGELLCIAAVCGCEGLVPRAEGKVGKTGLGVLLAGVSASEREVSKRGEERTAVISCSSRCIARQNSSKSIHK